MIIDLLTNFKIDLQHVLHGWYHSSTTFFPEKCDDPYDQVNVLEEAFVAKAEERKDSHLAHRLASGAFALEAAMQQVGSRGSS